MWREPLTGNMGENSKSHKSVHETTTDSCTGKNGNEGTPSRFSCWQVTDSVIDTTASEALP